MAAAPGLLEHEIAADPEVWLAFSWSGLARAAE